MFYSLFYVLVVILSINYSSYFESDTFFTKASKYTVIRNTSINRKIHEAENRAKRTLLFARKILKRSVSGGISEKIESRYLTRTLLYIQ